MSTLTLDEFRKQTEGLPGNTKIIIHDDHRGRGCQSHVKGMSICGHTDLYTGFFASDGRGGPELEIPVVRVDVAPEPFTWR